MKGPKLMVPSLSLATGLGAAFFTPTKNAALAHDCFDYESCIEDENTEYIIDETFEACELPSGNYSTQCLLDNFEADARNAYAESDAIEADVLAWWSSSFGGGFTFGALGDYCFYNNDCDVTTTHGYYQHMAYTTARLLQLYCVVWGDNCPGIDFENP